MMDALGNRAGCADICRWTASERQANVQSARKYSGLSLQMADLHSKDGNWVITLVKVYVSHSVGTQNSALNAMEGRSMTCEVLLAQSFPFIESAIRTFIQRKAFKCIRIDIGSASGVDNSIFLHGIGVADRSYRGDREPVRKQILPFGCRYVLYEHQK